MPPVKSAHRQCRNELGRGRRSAEPLTNSAQSTTARRSLALPIHLQNVRDTRYSRNLSAVTLTEFLARLPFSPRRRRFRSNRFARGRALGRFFLGGSSSRTSARSTCSSSGRSPFAPPPRSCGRAGARRDAASPRHRAPRRGRFGVRISAA